MIIAPPVAMPIAVPVVMPVVMPVAVPQPAQPGDGAATTSLVMGILGLVSVLLAWVPFCGWATFTFPVLGIIFGFVGLQSKARRGSAIAGLVCSIVALGLQIVVVVAIAQAIAASSHA
jgi:hypothetical protein